MSVKSATAFGLSSGLEPAMVFLTTQSFSAASSFSLPDNTFTSTYDNYKIIVQLTGVSADTNLNFRIRAAGTDLTAASYYGVLIGREVDNDAYNANNNGDGSLKIIELDSGNNNSSYHFSMEIIGPKTLTRTLINYAASGVASSGAIQGSSGAGLVYNDLSYDSMTMFTGSGTVSGKYSVYGYNK